MIRIWWNAARPGSLVKVALPVGAGLSIGYAHSGELRPLTAVAALLYAWLVQLLIIFLNDFADVEADKLHTERFPELIDERAVPLGLLTKHHLAVAGALVVAALVGSCIALSLWLARPWAPLFAGGAILFLWAYSFRPIRLNYRGMGELLETVGVGGVLPWAGYYFYTGELDLPVLAIGPLLLLALSSSLTSGLKHLPADLITGKKTASVLFGSRPVVYAAVAGVVASIALCGLLALWRVYQPFSVLLTVALPVLFVIVAAREATRADYEHLASLKIFKGSLHRAIYATNLGVILSFLWQHLQTNGA